MDYPERWKQKLPTEEQRREIGKQHWRPKWWQMLLLLAAIAVTAAVFWPPAPTPGGG